MKVLFVIDGFDPRLGGNVEAVRQLATEAARQGHHVTVVGARGPERADPHRWPGVELAQTGRPRARVAFSRGLRGWIRCNYRNYDAIVLNGLWRYAGVCAWLLLQGAGRRYYLFTHGGIGVCLLDSKMKLLVKSLYWRFVQHRVVRDAVKVFFTSDDEIARSKDLFVPYSCNPTVVPLGTALPDDQGGVDRVAFLSRFPALEGMRCLLFVGRIHYQKGVDILVQAFARLTSQDRRLRLVVVGPDAGVDVPRLARQAGIADRIICTGALFGREKIGAFKAAEVCVVPSRFESFSLVTIESLACDTPVIVSNCVPLWRTIAKNGAGLACEPTVDGVHSALASWLSLGESDRVEYRRRALSTFKSSFDIRRVTQSFLQALN